MAANYVLLEKITVGAAGASSVTFSNIPQTGYTDLVVKMSARDATISGGFSTVYMKFNGSTLNRSSRWISGNGSVASSSSASDMYLPNITALTATTSTFGTMDVYIPNYSGSQYKSYSADVTPENNGTLTYMTMTAGLWSDTSAITSITYTSDGTFAQYSTFYLYGVAKLGTTPAIQPYATGGDTIMTDGTYWYHTFLSSGTFTPAKALSCDYLVVAGGGGGGFYGGGGGAGGMRSTVTATGGGGSLESKLSLGTSAYTVTVGAGGSAGAATATQGTNGSNSVFNTITSTGGGYGSSSTYPTAANGSNGGSGGGAAPGSGSNNASGAGGTGTANQGYAGGAAWIGVASTYSAHGGGGGANAVGAAATTSASGNGGNGVATAISGSSVTYAGGGGGGGDQRNAGVVATPGSAGSGGGGAGSLTTGSAGTANTGGGGGGGGYNNVNTAAGGAGGSGIVIVRYAI